MTRGHAGARRGGVGPLLAALALLAACTESPLTPEDPASAPGPAIETREVRVGVRSLPQWRDTSLVGFANPGDAGSFLVATQEGLRARTLLRFSAVPDSVTQFEDTLFVPIDSFANASLFIRMDTTSASTFPPLPLTLRLHALERPFDRASASWTRASEGEPWASPGGDLGPELASFVLQEMTDSLSFLFEVPEDSLLEAWSESEGQPGIALTVAESGARIRITSTLLIYDAFSEGIEAGFPFSQSPGEGVFIYEPQQPPPGLDLRVGGLPSWRAYMEFRLPDEVDGTPLQDVAVSHAELVFHPLDPPADPFGPSVSLVAQGIQLLGDPFELGAKTPIGSGGQSVLTLDPDSLAAGRPVRLDITSPVVTRLTSGEATRPIRIGMRGTPDAQQLGFWDFGSVEHPIVASRPELLLVFSLPPDFQVP